jgi:hypothetical protein
MQEGPYDCAMAFMQEGRLCFALHLERKLRFESAALHQAGAHWGSLLCRVKGRMYGLPHIQPASSMTDVHLRVSSASPRAARVLCALERPAS